MVILEESNRIKNIEGKFNGPIKDLLYQMHFIEDLKHRDIGSMLNAPRTTVTKWFHRLQVPTLSCRRFTDKNLTSWLYKTGRLKKKPKYNGPSRRVRIAYKEDFFKKWSNEMAYVLGYFAADGCMFINPRGSKYVSFTSTDKEILEKVKQTLQSGHKLTLRKHRNKNWKDSFTLQIGSKEMYGDLIALGFMQNKASRFSLPKIPEKYASHFIRGYFDGDGSVTYGYFIRRNRNNKRTPYVSSCFASANTHFLTELSKKLTKYASMGKGCLNKKSGHLNYSKLDSIKLFRYMYKGITKNLRLERKYTKFIKAINSRWHSSAKNILQIRQI